MKAINIENQKFGYLTALEPIAKIKRVPRSYKCICICGKNVIRTVSNLRNGGNRQSCGCKYFVYYEENFNLKNKTFGDLLIIQRLGSHKSSKSIIYLCECICGKQIELTSKALQRRKIINCGCKIIPGKKLPGDQAIFNKLLSGYKSNAKRKNLPFTLTNNECRSLFKGNCFYCGVEPKQIFTHKKSIGEFIYNGIDRLNNDMGYSLMNTASCCTKCNFIKNKYSYIDFYKWIDTVYNYRINSNILCNLCNANLKQIRVDGDDKILSCVNCKLGDDSKFELRFDVYNNWLGGRCVVFKNNKYYSLIVDNYGEKPEVQLCELPTGNVMAPVLIKTINEKLEIKSLTEKKIKTILTFS
jgi:hypothetical protein